MNPMLRSFLIASAKNAVNAILTNAGLLTMFSQTFQFHTHEGIVNLVKATVLVVLSREALVWGPKVMAWSQSSEDSK